VDDISTVKLIAQLIASGGFAVAVWWELRAQRIERRADAAAQSKVLTQLAESLASVLERLRMTTPVRGVRIPTKREDD
jgi:hypothetical protein